MLFLRYLVFFIPFFWSGSAMPDQRCEATCKSEGRCSWNSGPGRTGCAAISDEHCRKSEACKIRGACHVVDGRCAPKSDADCRASGVCQTYRACVYFGEGNPENPNRCVKDRRKASADNDEGTCKKSGGKWLGRQRGRGRITGCNLPTEDGGKACTDSSQCESACVHNKCYEWSQFRGCGLMHEGKQICVD